MNRLNKHQAMVNFQFGTLLGTSANMFFSVFMLLALLLGNKLGLNSLSIIFTSALAFALFEAKHSAIYIAYVRLLAPVVRCAWIVTSTMMLLRFDFHEPIVLLAFRVLLGMSIIGNAMGLLFESAVLFSKKYREKVYQTTA